MSASRSNEKCCKPCSDTVINWPCVAKSYSKFPTCEYVLGCGDGDSTMNVCDIPIGSIYFGSRRGPTGDMSAKFTGCNYNIVGIVYQSCKGTVVYTVGGSNVGVVSLSSLIKDNSIMRHAIMPIKGFAKTSCPINPTGLGLTQDDGHLVPGQGGLAAQNFTNDFIAGSTSFGANYNPHKGDVGTAKHGVSACDSDYYNDCCDDASYADLLEAYRICEFEKLFEKYDRLLAETDGYQKMASILGLPVSEEMRTKTQFTAPELVSLILLEMGLISDKRFPSGPCADDYSKTLAAQAANSSNTGAMLILSTPANYNSCCAQAQACVTACVPVCAPSAGCVPCAATGTPQVIQHAEAQLGISATNDGVSAAALHKGDGDDFVMPSTGSYGPADGDAPHVVEVSSQDQDRTLVSGCYGPAACAPCAPVYTGGCCPPLACAPVACKRYRMPYKTTVDAQTVLVGSMREVDLLIDYYAELGISPNGNDFWNVHSTNGGCGVGGEIQSAVDALAAQRLVGDKYDYDFNLLKTTDWYVPVLIKIELQNVLGANPKEDASQICNIATVVSQLANNYTMETQIALDDMWTGGRLKKVSQKFAWACNEVHSIAVCTPTCVNYGGSCCGLTDTFNMTNNYCAYSVPICAGGNVAPCVVTVPNSYYYGCDWSYQLGCSPYTPASSHTIMCTRLEHVVVELRQLKLQTPRNSIMMNLVSHLLTESECLLEWLLCPPVCPPCEPCYPTNYCCPAPPVCCGSQIGVPVGGYGPCHREVNAGIAQAPVSVAAPVTIAAQPEYGYGFSVQAACHKGDDE